MLSAILDARRVIRAEHPDATVVYCVQPIMALLLAWMLGGVQGRLYPTFTGLGSLWTDLDQASWKKRLVRVVVEGIFGALLPQATQVFVLNRDDKAQVASWNPGKLAHKVIQTQGEGVDLEQFKPPTLDERLMARSRWGIPAEARVIGFVGRLIQEKGARDFLCLCRELQSDRNVHFLVVGDPDPGNPTSLCVDEMKELESVPRLHRECWMQDVRPAYMTMDVLVFLSAREGLPVSPLEAMAMGVPVVAYDAVGTREVVPECWRVFPGDRMTLCAKLRTVERGFVWDRLVWDRAIIQRAFLSSLEGNV